MTAGPPLPRADDYTPLEDPPAAAGAYTADAAIEAAGMGRFQYMLLLLTGLCWTAESMEMLLLSFIKQPLQCAWGISDARAALVTTAVGAGMLTGSTVWGLVADAAGRRAAFIASTAVTFVMGLVSAFSVNYPMILLARGAVGFGIGGVPVSFSLLMEFLPASHRGSWGMAISLFWSLGAIFEAALAMAVLPALGWRWLIALSSAPLGLVLALSFLVRESPRWLVARGRLDRAQRVLDRVAALNARPLPPGTLVASPHEDNAKRAPTELLRPGVRSLTLKIFVMWFSSAFVYYGLVMLQPDLIAAENAGRRCSYASHECASFSDRPTCVADDLCKWTNATAGPVCQPAGTQRFFFHTTVANGHGDDSAPRNKHPNAGANAPADADDSKTTADGKAGTAEAADATAGEGDGDSNSGTAASVPSKRKSRETAEEIKAEACANQLTKKDFLSTLWASVGELPGVLVAFAVINVIGRRPLIGYMFGVSGVLFVVLLACLGRVPETIVFFISRGTSTGAFQATYVFTNELYPARIRGTAMGVSSSVARVGLIITPLVAQYLSNINVSAAMWTYFAISFAAVLAVLLVPIETTGRPLLESMDELVALLRGEADTAVPGAGTFAKDPRTSPFIRLLRWSARIDGGAQRSMEEIST